jgi:predicted RNase H-like nuclease
MCKRHHCDRCHERQRERNRLAREARRANTAGPARLTLDELLDEINLLVGSDHPASIAHRLGYRSPDNLARRLYRAGLDDLARRFQRVGA